MLDSICYEVLICNLMFCCLCKVMFDVCLGFICWLFLRGLVSMVIFFWDENFSVKDLGVRESWVGFGFINRLSGGFLFLGIYN